jgi:hypothetical protein
MFKAEGQIIDSKNQLSISSGAFMFGGSNKLFFQPGLNHGGISFRADYLHTLLPWFKIGVEGSYLMPRSNDNLTGFLKTEILNENITTAGISTLLCLPYRENGWRNRLKLQLGIAPVAVIHSGERIIKIDNIVWNMEQKVPESSSINLNTFNTWGLSLTPSIEYFLAQRSGVKLSCNTLFTTFNNESYKEKEVLYSVNLGIFLAFSKNKHINY